MGSGMRVNRRNVGNGFIIILAILSITFSRTNSEEVKKPKADEYDVKPPGYPGSGTNQGKICMNLVRSRG